MRSPHTTSAHLARENRRTPAAATSGHESGPWHPAVPRRATPARGGRSPGGEPLDRRHRIRGHRPGNGGPGNGPTPSGAGGHSGGTGRTSGPGSGLGRPGPERYSAPRSAIRPPDDPPGGGVPGRHPYRSGGKRPRCRALDTTSGACAGHPVSHRPSRLDTATRDGAGTARARTTPPALARPEPDPAAAPGRAPAVRPCPGLPATTRTPTGPGCPSSAGDADRYRTDHRVHRLSPRPGHHGRRVHRRAHRDHGRRPGCRT